MLNRRKSSAFNLIESMIIVLILVIIMTIAIPSFTGLIEKQRLISAAESINSDLRWARTESIKRNINVKVSFINGTNWSYTIIVDPAGNPISIKTVTGSNFPSTTVNAAFSSNSYTTFDPVRGTAVNGTVSLASSHYGAQVTLSILGRTRICGIGGYDPC